MFYTSSDTFDYKRKPDPNQLVTVNPNHPRNSQMVAWWMFNEAGLGNLDDLFGISNGTVLNGAFWVDTPYGRGLDFGGGGATTQNVDCGADAKISTTTSNLTIAATVFVRSFGGGSLGRIIDKRNGSNTQGWGMAIANAGVVATFELVINTNTIASPVSNIILVNNWYRVVASYDGTNGYFYLNGLPYGQSGGGSGAIIDFAGHCIIGNRGDLTRNFDGIIADVEVFNRVWTPAEALEDYVHPYGRPYFPRILTTSSKRRRRGKKAATRNQFINIGGGGVGFE